MDGDRRVRMLERPVEARRPQGEFPGIEGGNPTLAVTREWSRHSDLNRGPAVYETAALPLSYVGADQE